jgi:hypothetical protein
MPLILGAQSAVATGFSVDNSCRFNRGDEPILTRTQSASPTNADICTMSLWFKPGAQTATAGRGFSFGGSDDVSNRAHFYVESTSDLYYYGKLGGSVNLTFQSDMNLRDPGAWYHYVLAIDTTQAVEASRIRSYINNVEVTSWSTSTSPSQNDNTPLNTGTNMLLGAIRGGSYQLYAWADAYLAEIVFIDGQQLTPSSFGEADEDSPTMWKPIDVSDLTFGVNGFYLDFHDSADLGNDISGNNNDFTSTNLAAVDQCTDSPTNNFCTMNPLENYYSNMTFTEGNTTVKSDHPAPALSTIGLTKGKWYMEGNAFLSTTGGAGDWQIGIVGDQVVATSDEIGNHAKSWAYYGADGDYINNNGGTSYGDSYGYAIIGVALDLDNNKLYFAKDGVWQDSGDPTSGATGTGAISISAAADAPLNAYFIACGANASSNDYTWKMNFGNPAYSLTSAVADGNGYGQFEYAPPSGYLAICTKNLGSDGG